MEHKSGGDRNRRDTITKLNNVQSADALVKKIQKCLSPKRNLNKKKKKTS